MGIPRTPVSTAIDGKIIFLGTGTSVGVPVVGCDCVTCSSTNPKNNRTRCALAIGLPEGNLLVDTPPDIRTQLLRERIGIIHSVLYTHGHADHLFGLDDMRIFPAYLNRPVPVHCEGEVEARLRKSFDYVFDPATPKYPGGIPQLDINRITTEPFSLLGAPVIPFRLNHGKFRVLGFRFGNIAYCTDTNGIPEESWALLDGLDVLILDALRLRPHPTHFNLEQAVEVARLLNARITYFTHIAHELEHEATNASLPPNMKLAYDGLQLDLY